jgi:hypothetical protein
VPVRRAWGVLLEAADERSQPGSPDTDRVGPRLEPTVTGRPATHDRAPGWSPATPDRVTVGRVTPVRRKTETLGSNASHCLTYRPACGHRRSSSDCPVGCAQRPAIGPVLTCVTYGTLCRPIRPARSDGCGPTCRRFAPPAQVGVGDLIKARPVGGGRGKRGVRWMACVVTGCRTVPSASVGQAFRPSIRRWGQIGRPAVLTS